MREHTVAILHGMPTPSGLCDSCAHQRLISNTRGSRFSLCLRSRSDPAYPRYPRLPVLECAGYERRAAGTRPSREDG